MPLPLQDRKNPLHGLPIERQFQVIAQWKEKKITPSQLLSLPESYTQDQITKAYRQLAGRFHPDKNPDNQAAAEAAFKIICAACEYAKYGLKKGVEKYEAEKTIINNPFYWVYDKQGLRVTVPRSAHRAAKRAKPYEEMDFFELLLKILRLPHRVHVLPVGLIAALKQHIINDPTLINTYQPTIEGSSQTVGQIIATFGDFDFLTWLLDRGADPRLMTTVAHSEISKDIIYMAIEKGNIQFLHYLLQQRGQQVFYSEAKAGGKLHQWWWFRAALSRRQLDIALFLLEEAGFSRHIHEQSLRSYYDCVHYIKHFLTNNGHGRLSTPSKKKLLQIANLFLNHEDVSAEFLCLGIDALLDAIEELLKWSRRNEAESNIITPDIFALIIQQIERINIQSKELGVIHIDIADPSNQPDTDNPRQKCLSKLYSTALRNANVEIFQRLQAISGLPALNKMNREKLLWLSISYCRGRGMNYWPDAQTKKEVEINYQYIITSLLDSNCFGTLDENYTIKFYGSEWTKDYEDYTLLHFACEAEWQEWALQLIARMPDDVNYLNARVTRKDCEYQAPGNVGLPSPKQRTYRYCPLHMAIRRGLTKVAVQLIEKGADINLKAEIDKPQSGSCWSLFSKRQHTEQTPLEMAIEKQQPQVIRALQRVMLENYIHQREQEPEYLSRFIVFGYVLFELGCFNFCGLILGFGTSKTDKLEQAYAFRDLLDSNSFTEAAFNQFTDGAARGGRLGEIVQLSQYYLAEEPLVETSSLTI